MQLIADCGGSARHLPLFRIDTVEDSAHLRAVLDRSRGFEGWIFTSANAARIAAEIDAGAWPRLFAIGTATAEELSRRGHPGAIAPSGSSTSEALLALPELDDVAGARFLICTGENGRGLLEQRLRERGASAEVLNLYRRIPIEHEAAIVKAAIEECDAVIVTSAESLHALWRLAPADTRPQLLARQLVTPSPRVVELARLLGFPAPLAPAQVNDEALLRCLEPPVR